ncbi:SCO family protein [Bizionia sediminis]|uniref:SCO family protein n=1 Tax=Bizionia sediminis TaxID=1737064 RepID=A0ABW5KUW6_9FLAO
MSKKANYSYVGISFVILVFGIWFVPRIVNRITQDDTVRNASRSEQVSTLDFSKGEASDLVYLNINGEPKKVPEFSFTNQDGQTITDKDYLGKVYLVEFFFTTCPTICPRMNRNLVSIQNEFKNNKDFGIASFTIMPKVDTPEVLKAYAKEYGVTNPNWHFLTGDQDAIFDLANLGFNIFVGLDETVPEGFEHSGNFALIDKKGFIRSRQDDFGNPKIFYSGIISEAEQVDEDGQREEISMLKEDIAKLLKE